LRLELVRALSNLSFLDFLDALIVSTLTKVSIQAKLYACFETYFPGNYRNLHNVLIARKSF